MKDIEELKNYLSDIITTSALACDESNIKDICELQKSICEALDYWNKTRK